ncbi:MAG: amidohydrolase family protein [Alphaproteobacteria bacterium]|nr:amidohydrolase family protein [Alphaproteobacteria bacterium]
MSRWIRGGSIYDVHTGTYRRQDIEIAEGRIARLANTARPAAGDDVIDAKGAFLLPGLIDCHVHLCMPTEAANPDNPWRGQPAGAVAIYAAEAARRTLLAGITTARDVGGWDYHEIAVRGAINRGIIPGPRLFCAGRLLSITTATVDYYPGMYEVADGPDEIRRAARRQLAQGADFIKIMATGALTSSEYEDSRAIQYTLEEIKVAVAIAEDNYKYVAAHAHAEAGIRNAALAGCRSIEHGSFGNEEIYGVMAEKGTYLVPTCCVVSAMLADNQVSATVPRHIHQRYVEFDEIHLKNVGLAKRCGVPIAMGTDAGTPGNHHGDNAQELVSMVRGAGLSPHESVAAATIDAARLLRQEANLGSLEVGKFADVIALAEDPLARIEAVRDVRLVMKGGAVVRDDLAA